MHSPLRSFRFSHAYIQYSCCNPVHGCCAKFLHCTFGPSYALFWASAVFAAPWCALGITFNLLFYLIIVCLYILFTCHANTSCCPCSFRAPFWRQSFSDMPVLQWRAYLHFGRSGSQANIPHSLTYAFVDALLQSYLVQLCCDLLLT